MKGNSNSSIWNFAKEIRFSRDFSDSVCEAGLLKENKNIKEYLIINSMDLQRLLNISVSTDFLDNIPRNTFENALKLYVYLNFCPSDVIDSPWTKLTKDLFRVSSVKSIISFLSRVILTSKRGWANKILESITSKYDLQYNNIYSMALDGANGKNTGIEDWSTVHEISNHPVHIRKADGSRSPSAFIPFCYFGGNAEDDGLNVDDFKYPVCNMFKAKVLNDQLCYEVDVNDLKTKKTAEDLKAGLTILVDYNEDRQIGITKVDEMKTESELRGKVFRLICLNR